MVNYIYKLPLTNYNIPLNSLTIVHFFYQIDQLEIDRGLAIFN